MKIKVTYEVTDLKRLIRADMARQGISATDDDVSFAKNTAVVSVEVETSAEPVAEVPVAAAPVARKLPVSPDIPPPLEVIEGGAVPADFSDILRASNNVEKSKQGLYPPPERHLMSGESYDFPGDKNR